jgi:hypothetical protein
MQPIVPDCYNTMCVSKCRDVKGSWRQSKIDQLLPQMASKPPGGRCIMQLKKGDPFLFRRTRTKMCALQLSGVPYTYMLGLSSCIAGPHLGGILLTDALMGFQSFGKWSGINVFGRSCGLGNKGGGGGNTGLVARQHGPWGMDVLVFLMIRQIGKLDALCRYMASCGNN